MALEKKACEYCGKLELMAHSCNACLACRIKQANKTKNKYARNYYERHRAKILQKMKDKRNKERAAGIKFAMPKEPKRAPRWTVEYIKLEGGYTWRAWFRNPETGRLVKFESGRQFETLLMAKKDYSKATC